MARGTNRREDDRGWQAEGCSRQRMSAEWLVPRLSYVPLVYETSTQTNRFFSKTMLQCLCASQTLDSMVL